MFHSELVPYGAPDHRISFPILGEPADLFGTNNSYRLLTFSNDNAPYVQQGPPSPK